MNPADAVIVGGGLIGCSLAAELAARGLDVAVVERGEPGGEASGAAAGMLSPQLDGVDPSPFFDLAVESRERYPDFVGALREETGLDVGYRRTGALRVVSEAEATSAKASAAWQRRRGLRVEELTRASLDPRIADRLGPEAAAFLFLPDEAVVDPRRLTRAAWILAQRRGVSIRTGVSVRGFRFAAGVCRGVETDAGAIEAPIVVDAAGAWAAFAGMPFELPVEPVRGQIVDVRLPGAPLETIVSGHEVYVVPRADGRALVGSTLEHVGFRKEVTAGAVAGLLAAAARLLPEVAAARFETAWAGLRPGTPDGWPILGRSPVDGLFLAAGHFRSGILLAPVTSVLLADLLLGQAEPAPALAPFSIERFGVCVSTL